MTKTLYTVVRRDRDGIVTICCDNKSNPILTNDFVKAEEYKDLCHSLYFPYSYEIWELKPCE